MHNCEIFSIRKSKADYELFEWQFDRIPIELGMHGVDVRFKTEINADPKKINAAVHESLEDDAADIFLFANALNSQDNSSFRNLFYELVSDFESELTADEAHEGMIPKIKIFSLGDLGCGYRGYCFMYRKKIFIVAPYASLAQESPADLLSKAVVKADEVITRNRLNYPDGIVYLSANNGHAQAAKKKEGFFGSFIPHRGDSRASIIRKTVVLVAILAFLGALVYVLDYFIFAPMQNTAITAEIQEIGYRRNTDETTSDGEKLPEQDWDKLKKINSEIVGWIRLDNTPIDYPVLWNKKDDQNYQHYLKHTYKNEYSEYGSIFVDYRCKDGTKSKNVILHGHNMINGSMFHELINYSDKFTPKLDYYKKHAVFTFNTPDGDTKWKVISVFKTSTLYAHGEFFNYMQADFGSDAEFMNFVYNVRERSMFNIPVMVNEDDQVLTLSTCSYEFTSFRTVVVARKVRPGEDESVDVQLATVNPSPLYPEVYYEAYGGSRPDVKTFKQANAKGQVSWYDGKGELEGSEDLTATIAANPTEAPTKKGQKSTKPAPSVYYQVIYRNIDGAQFEAFSVAEGDPVPVPDQTPTYEDDNFYYVFKGWDYDIEGVDINKLNTSLEIYPIYEPVAK